MELDRLRNSREIFQIDRSERLCQPSRHTRLLLLFAVKSISNNPDREVKLMDYDPELGDNLDALEALVCLGYIDKDTPAYGIAKLYLHEGESALSEKQKFIFDKHVAPVLFKECTRCGEGIELTALALAYEEGSMLCSYHMHKHHKDE